MLSETPSVVGLRHKKEADDRLPAAVTDIGCERDINEDRYAVIDCPKGRAWIVCDGMGGALGGELAAQLAIDAMRRKLQSEGSGSSEHVLVSAIQEANRIIVLRRQNPAFSAMGTTIVASFIHHDEVVVSHAGDSRAYLVRGREIQQLTTDHTYVQDLVDRGVIRADEALSHPQAHVLTRCLGSDPRLELHTQKYWIWDSDSDGVEDKLLLCSDGLYSLVNDEEMAGVIAGCSPQESCARLVELAKQRGGYDNITLAILPLGGQLRDEKPKKTSTTTAAELQLLENKSNRRQLARPRSLTFRQRIALMLLLFTLGGLTACVGMLLHIVGS